MRRTVDKLIQQYGTDLILNCNGEEKAARGFLRAVTSHSWQSMEPIATPLGEVSRGQYTYIGQAAYPVNERDTVSLRGKTYRFCRVEPYYYGDELIYYWGACIEKGGAEPWGAQS